MDTFLYFKICSPNRSLADRIQIKFSENHSKKDEFSRIYPLADPFVSQFDPNLLGDK